MGGLLSVPGLRPSADICPVELPAAAVLPGKLKTGCFGRAAALTPLYGNGLFPEKFAVEAWPEIPDTCIGMFDWLEPILESTAMPLLLFVL